MAAKTTPAVGPPRDGNLMTASNTAADLLRQITDSAGSGHLNRAHQRSFSLNVFQMNAVELLEGAQRVLSGKR
jgi:hypothetical protein